MYRRFVGAIGAVALGAALLIGTSATPAAAQSSDFAGTVALSNCSGSVVQLPNSAPDDPAFVMSNGHCLEGGFPNPGEVIVDEPSSRSFELLDASGNVAGTLQASTIAYATMTRTDVSLYQLTSSYAEIEQEFGIEALNLSPNRPSSGIDIDVVSGYWTEIYSCSVDGFAFRLQEADWTWWDSIRYTPDCQVIGGTSGSPVIDAGTGDVVGVNNTLNESGEECTMNNPCEIDRNGETTVHQGIGYAQQTYRIAACVGDGNQIDLSLPGCKLAKP